MNRFLNSSFLLAGMLLLAPSTQAQDQAQFQTFNHALDVPLGNAIVAGKADEVKKLLDQGADPNAFSSDATKSPMLVVASAVDVPVDIAKMLITAGANLEGETSRGDTPLVVAAIKGRLEVVNLLINSGAKLESQDDLGLTPLIFAAATSHADIVKSLVQAGANVNARAKDGGSALVYNSTKSDAGSGTLATAQMLVNAGADVSAKAGDDTAQSLAEKSGLKDIAEYLDKIAQRDESLLKAVAAGHWGDAKKMMDKGANPRYQTRLFASKDDKVGALSTAAFAFNTSGKGFDEATALQVLKRSDLEATDEKGNTALYEAVDSPTPDLIKIRLLLQAGANPDAVGKTGKTPVALAKEKGNAAVIQAFEAAWKPRP